MAQLARIDPASASEIKEFRRIIGFRNILIHGYAEIDHRIVWGVLETKLPVFQMPKRCLAVRNKAHQASEVYLNRSL